LPFRSRVAIRDAHPQFGTAIFWKQVQYMIYDMTELYWYIERDIDIHLYLF
jgi:hypothetical protein